MALKTEKIKLNGVEYTVKELSVRVLLPLISKMSGENIEGQIELLGLAVEVNGQPLGAGAGELGASTFMPLIKRVTAINGMDADAGNGG